MSWFVNRSTMTKLILGFSVLSVLMVVMGYVAISGMGSMNDNTETLYEKHLKGLHEVDEANTSVAYTGRSVRVTILASSPAEKQKAADLTAKNLADFQAHLDKAEPCLITQETKQKFAEIKTVAPEWIDGIKAAIALAVAGKDKEALQKLQSTIVVADKLAAGLDGLKTSKFSVSQRGYEDSVQTFRTARVTLLAVIVGGLVVGLTLGYLIARIITRPLNRTVTVLEGVAKGDLSQRAEIDSRDEVGRLATALNTAIGTLQTARERDADFQGQIAAVSKVQAVIEFKLDGTIVTANENFLSTLGYSLSEIQGRHHSMFVEPSFAASHEYRDFWAKLGRGEYQAGEFKRVGRGGKEVWIQGSYNPIFDVSGKPYKVVKYATDITTNKNLQRQVKENAERDAAQAAELRRKVDAILLTVNAMSAGDFTQQVADLGDDAVGQMAAALNQAITAVREALEGVREVSEQLADASGQLASASEEIATGAQQQASSLEETASTLEEITATVKQNSDSAQQARQLASGSKDVAEKGGQVVGNAVEAMSEINQSSKKIAEIITAIDEIAFQTNLLALNAAVEAARAGEQGRGFAVVAAEVRNLAQRSATAAKEIKALIQDSVKKVEAGSELVNRSGNTLTEIVTSVKRVTDIVTEIAAASREQSTGIDQVNKAVTQMDTVTQRNASQTEEMSATAQTLTDQAGQLRELVSRFKLGQNESVRPVVSRAAAAGNGKTKAPAKSKPRPAVAQAMKNGHAHELDRLGSTKADDGFTEF